MGAKLLCHAGVVLVLDGRAVFVEGDEGVVAGIVGGKLTGVGIAQAPRFTPQPNAKVHIDSTPVPAPRLDTPKGYKPVQISDFVADTYMKFRTTETAHDFRLSSVEGKVSALEVDRNDHDRPEISTI